MTKENIIIDDFIQWKEMDTEFHESGSIGMAIWENNIFHIGIKDDCGCEKGFNARKSIWPPIGLS